MRQKDLHTMKELVVDKKLTKRFETVLALKKAFSSLKKSSPVVLEPNLTLFTLSLKLGSVRGLQKDAIKVAL